MLDKRAKYLLMTSYICNVHVPRLSGRADKSSTRYD